MKFDINDNMANVLIAIVATVALSLVSSCWMAADRGQNDVDKAHIAAGECKNSKTLLWIKCESLIGK